MPKTDPISVSCETHGLAGNLILPDNATPDAKVPGALVVGGPGPAPLSRYTAEGAKQWPVLWTEALAKAGIAGLCYDQRGSGLSSGTYHDADWEALYEDAKACADLMAVQPEIGQVAAIAWGDGCGFALRLAAEGQVQALVLLAPPYHNAEERYAADIAALAAKRGLSDRVVQLRIGQWRKEMEAQAERVKAGQTTATMDMGGQVVTLNLIRFLQTAVFRAADLLPHVKVPILILHGQDDAVVTPSESQAMHAAAPDQIQLVTYPSVAHFLYRHPQAIKDAITFINQELAD